MHIWTGETDVLGFVQLAATGRGTKMMKVGLYKSFNLLTNRLMKAVLGRNGLQSKVDKA